MPGRLRNLFIGILLLTIVGIPTYYATWRFKRFRNFHVVEDGVLYRSGQLTLEGLQRLVHDHGIRTVITLRYPDHSSEKAPDQLEEDWILRLGMNHVRIPHKAWEMEIGGYPPQEENVKKFLTTMTDPAKYPVLVHCFAGKNRTGALCAIYRMEFNGWSCDRAIEEMKAFGYWNIADHQDLLKYLTAYERRGYQLGEPAETPGIRPVGSPVLPVSRQKVQ